MKLQDLSAGSITLTSAELDNAWPALGEVRTDSDTVPVSLYIRSIGGSGRNRPTERRLQNPADQNSRAISAPASGYALLLGLWTEQGDDRAVVVALDAYRRLGRDTRFSLFIPLSLLLEANRDGFAQHKSTSGEILYAFKPSRLGSYVEALIKRRQELEAAPFPADSSWISYRQWNTAVADAFYSEHSNGRLVYLDLDESTIDRIAPKTSIKANTNQEALIAAVSLTLDLGRVRGSIFAPHRNIIRRWRIDDLHEPPPCLALLAFFVVIAEGMGTDENFAGHNYYGRFAAAIGMNSPDQTNVLGRDFRADSTFFWNTLNSWLEDCDGRRGLPTAFAFDRRRFVSVPISQALVREADRIRLQQCFSNFGLRPGQRIAADDMEERVLADWIPDSNVSSALKRLWQRKETRTRIAEIACLELEVWDGTTEHGDQDAQSFGNLLLVASIRSQPRKAFEFAFITKEAPAILIGQYKVAIESPILEAAFGGMTVKLVEASFIGYMRLVSDAAINFGHALVADIRLKPVSIDQVLLSRRWKPLIVLRYDTEMHSYVETKRVELAERHVVICHQTRTDMVSSHLSKIAPGYERLDSQENSTVPKNWSVFTNVRVAGVSAIEDDELQALVPIARTNIVLFGGLALPSRNTWHARHPPNIQVATLNPDECSVQLVNTQDLTDSDTELPPIQLGSFKQVKTCNLQDLSLQPGDYRIVVFKGKTAASRSIASAGIRLRNAEHRRLVQTSHFAHCPEKQSLLWPLTSEELDTSENYQLLQATMLRNWPDEVAVDSSELRIPTVLLNTNGEAEHPPDQAIDDRPETTFTQPACIERGHHLYLIPYGGDNPPRHQTLLGNCKDCGIERWFGQVTRTRPRGRRSEFGAVSESRAIQLDFSPTTSEVSPDSFFDALAYLGGGNRRNVANMVESFSEKPWLTDELLRNLSALGHLEVMLDNSMSNIDTWQVSEPALNFVNQDLAYLSGYRTPQLLKRIREDAGAINCKISLVPQSLAPSRINISGLDALAAQDLADSVSASLDMEVHVSLRPSIALARRLPPFSEVARQLPLSPIPSLPCQKWDLQELKWHNVGKPERPGAYRFMTWGWIYGFINENLLAAGQYRSGDYRTIKHLAAVSEGKPMVAYDHSQNALSVPLGAELPWLYERSVVLESGLAPEKLTSGVVRYKGVSREVATRIWALLRYDDASRQNDI